MDLIRWNDGVRSLFSAGLREPKMTPGTTDTHVGLEANPAGECSGWSLGELRAWVAAGPPYAPEVLHALKRDPRTGARALYETCLLEQARVENEKQRLEIMMRFERDLIASGFKLIAGVDEAGRGPLAGPIVAAAVQLSHVLPGLNDSKQLSAVQRETLYAELTSGEHHVGVATIGPDYIDRYGIQGANYAAMARAVEALEPRPDFLLVDGFEIRGCPLPQKSIIKGDARSASIAAASIIAKVVRDRMMDEYDAQYPGYGFAANKGYGTREHLDALERLGPCPIHRKSFSPVTDMTGTATHGNQPGTNGLLF